MSWKTIQLNKCVNAAWIDPKPVVTRKPAIITPMEIRPMARQYLTPKR